MKTARQPNVIVFFTDQQRWDSTGVHGNPLELTPNFDRLAQNGTHLFHTFTPQPVCGPARSCLQTGQYATTTGVWQNGIPLSPDSVTLAKLFGQAGYQTGYIGKWHLAPSNSAAPGPVPKEYRGGYDYWLASNTLEFTSMPYSTTLYDNDQNPVHLPGYRVDAQTDAAIRYIDQHQHDPFFLFLSYIEPHHQNCHDNYPAPDGYEERYTGRWTPPDLSALVGDSPQYLGGYWGMIKRLDEALGRLLDALKSLDLTKDTIVLFTSDHACQFRTRNSEYKRSCHESSIRVPTALCGPGFDGGGRVQELASLVDLPATLLDATGIAVPETMQGRSLMPLLRRQEVQWPEEVFVQISESHIGRAVRTRRWKYSVRATEDAQVENGSANRYVEDFLYDLKSDPYELTNLAGRESHREAAGVMRERLLRRIEEAGEDLPQIELAPSKPNGQQKLQPGELTQ